MTAAQRLLAAWDGEPSVVAGCVVLAGAYAIWARGRGVRSMYFFGGVLLLMLALVSPLDALGDEYLFSAHVVQHFLLGLVVPPMLVLGMPAEAIEKMLRNPAAAAVERRLARPALAWTLGTGVMIFWHVPALFNRALANEGLHVTQHLSFLALGTIFWWPVLHPLKPRRLAAAYAVPYLFGACVCCSLLGAWLAFSPLEAYPAYLHPADSLGVLGLLRDHWGLTARSDRELGGMLMWVPGCFVYLTAILTTVARWFGAEREIYR